MASILTHAAGFRAAARRFAVDESGAMAVEYGLMTGIIGIALMTSLFALGGEIRAVLYDRIASTLAGMM